MGFAQVDNGCMEPCRPGRRWVRPAVVALALAALTAVLPVPASLAAPEPAGRPRSGPEALAAARAEAARLQREVDALDVEVETLAEAHSAAQARLDGLIQAAHRHQAELELSELALQTTRDDYAGDVRDPYARGPLAPLELLLAAGDIHELAVAAGVAGRVVDRDVHALAVVGLATGTVRAEVTEMDATQAETLALRQRLAGQEAAIGRLLADRTAMLATARAEVRAQVRAEQARQEAARRAMVAAASARARALGFATPGRHPGPRRHRRRGRPGRPGPGRQAVPLGRDRPGVVRLLGADPLRLRPRRADPAADLPPAVVGRRARRGRGAAPRRPGVLGPRPGRPGDHPPRRHVRRPGPDGPCPPHRGPGEGGRAAPFRLRGGDPPAAGGEGLTPRGA
jgi:peptidoglycan hydrolase CwlO-like protein